MPRVTKVRSNKRNLIGSLLKSVRREGGVEQNLLLFPCKINSILGYDKKTFWKILKKYKF